MSKKKQGAVALIVAVMLMLITALLSDGKSENIIGIWEREDEASIEFFEEGV